MLWGTLDPILVVLEAGEDYDKETVESDEDYEKMMDHAECLNEWLYWVSQSLVRETNH